MATTTEGNFDERSGHQRRMLIVFFMTFGYLAVEVIGGILTGSLALLADAGHMLTDVGGLAIALFAMRFPERPPTPQKSYGYYRMEVFLSFSPSCGGGRSTTSSRIDSI